MPIRKTTPSEGCTVYRVSQEECARLREGVPYVKVYRYNPKHLCPKLNGYGDNGQRKVVFWRVHTLYLSADSFIYVTSLSVVSYDRNSAHTSHKPHMYFLQGDDVISHVMSVLDSQVSYIMRGTLKDNYDMSASVFVVQFNGFMSLTS